MVDNLETGSVIHNYICIWFEYFTKCGWLLHMNYYTQMTHFQQKLLLLRCAFFSDNFMRNSSRSGG